MHPFKGFYLTSSAVHPDGRIFVSAKNFATSDEVTYSLDIGARVEETRWLGASLHRPRVFLPCSEYLGRISDGLGIRTIRACDLIPPLELDSSGGRQFPGTKLLFEPMFRVDCDEWHVGADLVFDGNMFCLVECVSIRQTYRNMFRLTMFSLMCNKDGDQTTGDSVRLRCYEMSDNPEALGYSLVNPVAFCLWYMIWLYGALYSEFGLCGHSKTQYCIGIGNYLFRS